MYQYNNSNDSTYAIIILLVAAVVAVLYIQNTDTNNIEQEQEAIDERQRKREEIRIKELKIKGVQDIIKDTNINELLSTQLLQESLTEEEMIQILKNMYSDCSDEIDKNINNNDNMTGMINCFTNIEEKRKLLEGNDECIIELTGRSGVDLKINDINLRDVDVIDIVKCIEEKNTEKAKETQHRQPVNDVHQIAEEIFDSSKERDNYLQDEYTTSNGIKYRVGALQEAGGIFLNPDGTQKSATKCGTSQKGVIYVGYDITITHPNGVDETTICIYRDGVMKNNILQQMVVDDNNSWYIYLNDKNQCDDWGVYIPHNGHSEQIKALEKTNKFKFFGAYEQLQGIKVKDNESTKYTVYYTKDYCQDVNQKRYVTWYYWNVDNDTVSCQQHNQFCCSEYTDDVYPRNESDSDRIQFLRLNDNKKRDVNKLNLYQNQKQCNESNYEIDTYRYDIASNKCINRNEKSTLNKIRDINKNKDTKKNVEQIYFSRNVCPNYIKKQYYKYDFDEVNKRNKCIKYISEKCNNYGDSNLCSFNELNEWIQDTGFDRNKVYTEDRLKECRDTYERDKRYSYDVVSDKCDEHILSKGQYREEMDLGEQLYYKTEDDCKKANLKYLAFNISGCHEPEARTFNELENTKRLNKTKSGEIIEINPYNKMNDSNGGKYGIIHTTQIWDNGFLMPQYSKDYYDAIDVCGNKANKLRRLMR